MKEYILYIKEYIFYIMYIKYTFLVWDIFDNYNGLKVYNMMIHVYM